MSPVLTDDDAKKNISANVRRLLAERGLSQVDLAFAVNESEARISQMIRQVNLPSAAFLARVAEALETSVDELLNAPEKISS